ncbi:hypothetical protein ACLI4Z_04810 [Natrialbaceae archaeon A-arb3/5]
MAQTRSLTSETVHELLANTRRRHLLSILNRSGTEPIDDLALKIAARERNEPVERIDEESRQRIAVSLVHKHIPMLEDHDIVRYNSDTRSVALMDVFDEIEHYMRQSTDETIFEKLIPGY